MAKKTAKPATRKTVTKKAAAKKATASTKTTKSARPLKLTAEQLGEINFQVNLERMNEIVGILLECCADTVEGSMSKADFHDIIDAVSVALIEAGIELGDGSE